MNKKTINDVQLTSKKVLMRVDFNVPFDENNHVTDSTRIREALPTIEKIISSKGKLILMSHLGRPKGKKDPKYSLLPVCNELARLSGKNVVFVDDCIGEKVEAAVAQLKDGEILLLENLRFYKEEEENDKEFSKKLAALGDVYVNDAFGTAHRAHASTEGVTHFIKTSVAGYLMEKELKYLGSAVANPKRPFVAILGGAKISGKIDVLEHLMDKVDTILVGGAMIFTFYKAQGIEVGNSMVEADKIDLAKTILAKAKDKKIELLLPVDVVLADKFDANANTKEVSIDSIPQGWMGLDIGEKSIRLFSDKILSAKTVVWNGPMGVFEMDKFSKGTFAIAKALVDATKKGAITIIGGGDSAAAITKAKLEKEVSHVSTGGGASLEFLEGKVLPGVEALNS